MCSYRSRREKWAQRTELIILVEEALQQLRQVVHAPPLVCQLAGARHHLPPPRTCSRERTPLKAPHDKDHVCSIVGSHVCMKTHASSL